MEPMIADRDETRRATLPHGRGAFLAFFTTDDTAGACSMQIAGATRGTCSMLLPAFTAASLLIVAAAPDVDPATMHLSARERTAAVQPSISRATECVERTVAGDPRSADASQLGDLIVDSMGTCRDIMR